MKLLVINGSPRRNGNTNNALQIIEESIKEQTNQISIEHLNVGDYKLSSCINCDGCLKNGGSCVLPDDSADIIEKISQADYLLLGSPVYWWGISSQLKMILDKFYSKDEYFHTIDKTVAIISVGAHPTTDQQYAIIKNQFQCICDYLGWNLLFSQGFSASDAGEILKDEKAMEKLKALASYF